MQESLLYPPPPPTSFDTPSDILGYGYLDNMNFPTVGTTRIAQLRLEGPSHMPSTANTHSTFYGEEDTYDPYLNVFREFEAYSFSDDPDYRAGLPTIISAIRGTKRSAAQIDEMIGRAQWFYFTRMKGITIPWEAYASSALCREPRPGSPAHTPSMPTMSMSTNTTTTSGASRSPTPQESLGMMNDLAEAKRMMPVDPIIYNGAGQVGDREMNMSFAMLCRLISEGKGSDIPNNKQIPDQLNPSPPSQPTMNIRPKPWEQRKPSPPGTSASFSDPPLAPSPPPLDAFSSADYTLSLTPDFQDFQEFDNMINGDSLDSLSYRSPLSSNPSPTFQPMYNNTSIATATTTTTNDNNTNHTTNPSSHANTSPRESYANLASFSNTLPNFESNTVDDADPSVALALANITDAPTLAFLEQAPEFASLFASTHPMAEM